MKKDDNKRLEDTCEGLRMEVKELKKRMSQEDPMITLLKFHLRD